MGEKPKNFAEPTISVLPEEDDALLSSMPPSGKRTVRRIDSDVRMKALKAPSVPEIDPSTITDGIRQKLAQLFHNVRSPLCAAMANLSYLGTCIDEQSLLRSCMETVESMDDEICSYIDHVRAGGSPDQQLRHVTQELENGLFVLEPQFRELSRHIPDDPEAVQSVKECLSVVSMIRTILSDTLFLCQQGEIPLAREPQDVGYFVERVVRRTHLPVLLRSLPRDPAFASFDANFMHQVLENLFSNAFKYGTLAKLTVVSHAGLVHLVVEDEGPGLPDDCDDLFSMYQRGKDTKGTHGYGIGLAFCKNVVEQHGGQILAENVVDPVTLEVKGARFTVQLPQLEEIPEGVLDF